MSNRLGRLALSAGLAVAATRSNVLAQAWLPPKGGGTLSFGFSGSTIGDHLFSSKIYGVPGGGPRSQDFGNIDSRSSTIGFSFGVLERFAISSDIAYVASRYDGIYPDNPAIDNGSWNSS